jgi:RHS repeat-associated protein
LPTSSLYSLVSSGASTSAVGYDTADRMTSLAHAFAVTSGNQSWTFAYSPASQVTAAAGSNTAYDWAGAPSATVNNTADGLNRDAVIAAASGYDGNGNLIFDGTRHFTYDGENRLLTESGPIAMALTYDPMGRLAQGVINGATTQFLYDGDNLVAEYDGSNNILRRYVHGPGVDNPLVWFEGSGVTASNASYLIADRQGSIVATANSSGAVAVNYTYDPYGVPNTWGGSRFRYTGQIELPEAQLYHYKARAYDPNMGHFLQTDPVGYTADVNLYAYVGGDPMNDTDPMGLAATGGCGNDAVDCSSSSAPQNGGSGGVASEKKFDRRQAQQQTTSAAGMAFIKGWEAWNGTGDKKNGLTYAKDDGFGNGTIGWGHNCGKCSDFAGGITKAQGDALLT